MGAIVVYSAVFGGYDRVVSPVVPGRHVLFTDGQGVEGWETWTAPALLGPQRTARSYKMNSHWREYAIWVDGNISLRVPPAQVVEEWLGQEYDMALFRHPAGDCVYDEAERCKHKHKDDPEVIDAQVARYRAAGMPARYGLGETCVMARRFGDAVSEFMAAWWLEVARGSVRDQLSFDYVRWTMRDRIRVRFVDGGPGWRRREHEWFECRGHTTFQEARKLPGR